MSNYIQFSDEIQQQVSAPSPIPPYQVILAKKKQLNFVKKTGEFCKKKQVNFVKENNLFLKIPDYVHSFQHHC